VLLNRIAFENTKEFSFDIIKYLALQLNCIMETELLVKKIGSLLLFYQDKPNQKSIKATIKKDFLQGF
jgi:hypothetical protein